MQRYRRSHACANLSNVSALHFPVNLYAPFMVLAELAFIGSTSGFGAIRLSLPPLKIAQPCGGRLWIWTNKMSTSSRRWLCQKLCAICKEGSLDTFCRDLCSCSQSKRNSSSPEFLPWSIFLPSPPLSSRDYPPLCFPHPHFFREALPARDPAVWRSQRERNALAGFLADDEDILGTLQQAYW